MTTISHSLGREIWAEFRPWILANPPLKWGLLAFGVFFTGLIFVNLPAMDAPRVLAALMVAILLAHSCLLAVQGHSSGQFGNARTLWFLALCAAIQFANTVYLIPRSWDSVRVCGNVLMFVFGFVMIFTLLPIVLRKATALALFSFHFLGLACLSMPGLSDNSLSERLLGKIFRRIQRPMYLSDNYHYLNRIPNVNSLLWFRIDYDDHGHEWYRMPEWNRNIGAIQYSRERCIGYTGIFCVINNDVRYVGFKSEDERNTAASNHVPKIPPLPVKSREFQTSDSYLISKPEGEKTLSSYVRHVAHLKQKSATGAGLKSVRIYLVFHRVMEPLEIAEGARYDDPRFYLPYFLGDYSTQGELLNPDDGLIGYPLPIHPNPDPEYAKPEDIEFSQVDYFFLHSGLDLFKERR